MLNSIKMKISYRYQIILIISFINIISSAICAKENYILSTVNTIPISKIDVINRAKLISFSINVQIFVIVWGLIATVVGIIIR